MQIGVMKTDNGPHSPEYWATVTAGQIIKIDGNDGSKVAAARKLENKIIDILENWHRKVQQGERSKIKTHGDKHIVTPLDATEHLDGSAGAVEEIIAATKGTPFEDHFAETSVQEYVRNLLGQHFSTNMFIERSYHADRVPNSEHAREFRKSWHGKE